MACWFRIDNRLVHGQVIEAWLPHTGARHLVVANDELAGDVLRQQIMLLAVPQRISTHFVRLPDLPVCLAACGEKVFVLFSSCQDAYLAYTSGVAMDVLNVGNLHYAPGKLQLLPHVAVSADELAVLRFLHNEQVELDFRCVPTETLRGYDVLL